MKLNEIQYNAYYTIVKNTIGITGHKTHKVIETLTQYETFKKYADTEIIEHYKDPFNSSITIITIA